MLFIKYFLLEELGPEKDWVVFNDIKSDAFHPLFPLEDVGVLFFELFSLISEKRRIKNIYYINIKL